MTTSVFGIDLDYRPSTYFWPLGLGKHLLTTIKGDLRREMIREEIENGNLASVPEALLAPTLDDQVRRFTGRLHPALMGGEYLPDLEDEEIEIARITISSTTQDVTVVRARRSGKQIHYRVEDEYEGETLSEHTELISGQPLTLKELEEFFNRAWSIYDNLEMNFAYENYDIDRMLNFVHPSSEFYPDFASLYVNRIIVWGTLKLQELDLDD